LKRDEVTIVIQVNDKLRDQFQVPADQAKNKNRVGENRPGENPKPPGWAKQ